MWRPHNILISFSSSAAKYTSYVGTVQYLCRNKYCTSECMLWCLCSYCNALHLYNARNALEWVFLFALPRIDEIFSDSLINMYHTLRIKKHCICYIYNYKTLMYVCNVCVYEDNLSFTREPLDVETRNECSKVSDCQDCWVSGLNILWCQVGPPGGQKRLFFGPRHKSQYWQCCFVLVLQCSLKRVSKNSDIISNAATMYMFT